nr:hypothetical protein Itr_chr02CG12430 [Ipomoea trifida]
MANHVPSSSHSDFIYSLDFEDTSICDKLNLDSLLEIENELYKLLEHSDEAEPTVESDPLVQVIEDVLFKPLSEIVIHKKKKNRVKKTFCDSKTVTKQMISSRFHLPVSKAAVELKVGLEDEDEQAIPFPSPDQDYRPVLEITDNSALDDQFNILFSPSIGESSHTTAPVCDFYQEIDRDLDFMNVMTGEHHDVATDAPLNVKEVSKSAKTIVLDKRTTKPWSFDTISPLFHLPASQAAKELNYLSKLKTYIVGKKRVIELQKENEWILKDPNIELCAETQVLMESSRKKRRYRRLMDISHFSDYANSSKVHVIKSEEID